jgi:hypothetical protein
MCDATANRPIRFHQLFKADARGRRFGGGPISSFHGCCAVNQRIQRAAKGFGRFAKLRLVAATTEMRLMFAGRGPIIEK